MNRLPRLAAVAALSALAVAAPSAANAIYFQDTAAAKAGAQSVVKNDPKGDVVAIEGTSGAPTEAMLLGADVKQVQVKAKKSGVTVTVRGVDFPDAAVDKVGLMAFVDLTTDGESTASAGYYSASLQIAKEGIISECDEATAVYDEPDNRLVFTFPKPCLGTATKVEHVTVLTSGYDMNGVNMAPTDDQVEVAKDLRLPGKAKGPKGPKNGGKK